MSRKEVMYLDLEKEVARLNREKAILLKEINDVIVKLSGLKEQQMIIEKNSKEVVSSAKSEAEEIIKKAKDIENEAQTKKSTIEIKLADLEGQKQSFNKLIKSNEGLEKNLTLEKATISEIKSKLLKSLEAIKEILK